MSTYAKCCKGLDTGNNELFLRLWQEVDIHKTTVLNNCGFWVPYNKGGSFRKWYGNNFYLVNWSNDGETLSNFKGSNIRNRSYHSKKELPGQLLLAVPLREENHRLDIFLIQRDVWLFPMEAFPWKNFWLK